MEVEYTLRVYYSRFGVIVEPYEEKIGFDYNRVYYSKDSVVNDFKAHGWTFAGHVGDLYTFRKNYG